MKKSPGRPKKSNGEEKKKLKPNSEPKSKEPPKKRGRPPKPKEEKKPVINKLFRAMKEKGTGPLSTFSTSDSKIDELRDGISKKQAAKEKKPSEKKASKKKKPDKKKPEPVPAFDQKTIVSLLKVPFAVGHNLTGYKYEMPKEYEPILGQTGEQLLKDFGIAVVSKWVNLGIFAGIYGSCCLVWLKGMREHAELQAAEQKKQKRIAAQEPTPADEIRPVPGTPPTPAASETKSSVFAAAEQLKKHAG